MSPSLVRPAPSVPKFVAVEMQDGQDGSVAPRIEKVHALPGPLKGRGFGLPVADNRDRNEVRVVEHGAERTGQHVPELAGLVNQSRRVGAHVARHPPGCRELAKKAEHPGAIAGNPGIHLAIRTLEPHVGENGRPTVSGSRKKQHIGVAGADDSIEVGVDKAQTG